jgi:hypothetical protein
VHLSAFSGNFYLIATEGTEVHRNTPLFLNTFLEGFGKRPQRFAEYSTGTQ